MGIFPRSFVCAALRKCPFNLAGMDIPGTSRLDLRSGRGQRSLAGTFYHLRCTRVAAVGCLDPAVLSLRGLERLEKALVLVWMFGGFGSDVQRTTAVRCAVFYFLA